MPQCTVHSPCGRYVVHFEAEEVQQRLRLVVTEKAPRPALATRGETAECASRPAPATTFEDYGARSTSPPTFPSARLVASMSAKDVVELTTSAGVRKSFDVFSKMLYDALIGRSTCVRFFVETVAEMKERIQRDVRAEQVLPGNPSTASPNRKDCSVPQPSGPDGSSGAIVCAAMPASYGSGPTKPDGLTGSAGNGRVVTAVGDTVIELDEDIAAEVLEQRFLTVDYDVDFTRAIFPIPLKEETTEGARSNGARECKTLTESLAGAVGASPHLRESSSTSPGLAGASLVGEVEVLQRDLGRARDRLIRLEAENARLQRENDALVQLSKHKMHEMQRVCEDFQHQVQLAAATEKLKLRNAELQRELREALEAQRAAVRTLDRERRERRLLYRSSSDGGRGDATVPRSCGSARWSASGSRDNPYLRSLSRDSQTSASRAPSKEAHDGRGRSANTTTSGRGRPLISPTPPPSTSRGRRNGRAPSTSSPHQHRPTRFDTPPAASSPGSAAAVRQRSRSRRSCSAGDGDGDSPAPRNRTGGRQLGARKPLSRSPSADAPRSTRASSSHSLPRRGPSLWADSNGRVSPCGSVASSRSSDGSYDRLYHASTASSRFHQTPKVTRLESAAARRAVFH